MAQLSTGGVAQFSSGGGTLAELNNGAIRELVTDLNNRPVRHLGTSRRVLFEAIERRALLPMPDKPYAYAEWRRCRAGLHYHVEMHGHFYSGPRGAYVLPPPLRNAQGRHPIARTSGPAEAGEPGRGL